MQLWSRIGSSVRRKVRSATANQTLSARKRLGRRFETLERREVFSADILPALMVIADQQDFYYKEYGDTRDSLEAAGITVQVAAATTNVSHPHPGSGELNWFQGQVTPDIALADVNPDDYSAIVFVGGWGSSMYQYAFPGDYVNDHYDGDPTGATQQIVNDLIGEFLEQDKYVAAVCHSVTILAWARIDGVSPIAGKTVSVPWIGSPAVDYVGVEYGDTALMQYEQVVANGAIANTHSGMYGLDPFSNHDDVVVDGRIITAENYDTAAAYGAKIAELLIAEAAVVEPPAPPVSQAPIVSAAQWSLAENSVTGAAVGTVVASDPDPGQSLSYEIVSGNTGGAFAIDSTGLVTVADAAALDFESNPVFSLVVSVADNGSPSLVSDAAVTIQLSDVVELAPNTIVFSGGNLFVQGTDNTDTIYIWTSCSQAFAWVNGVLSGPHTLGPSGRVIAFGAAGNDQIYATDSNLPVTIYGEAGHDQITGGNHDDILDGGDGWDRIWGGPGNDVILGGSGNDHLDGHEGDDVIVGGDGDDRVIGNWGQDVLIGGAGSDWCEGVAGSDLLIGGTTDYDANTTALLAILDEWRQPTSVAQRAANLQAGLAGGVSLQPGLTVQDDAARDTLNGGVDSDWFFPSALDEVYGSAGELLT